MSCEPVQVPMLFSLQKIWSLVALQSSPGSSPTVNSLSLCLTAFCISLGLDKGLGFPSVAGTRSGNPSAPCRTRAAPWCTVSLWLQRRPPRSQEGTCKTLVKTGCSGCWPSRQLAHLARVPCPQGEVAV